MATRKSISGAWPTSVYSCTVQPKKDEEQKKEKLFPNIWLAGFKTLIYYKRKEDFKLFFF